MGKVVGLLLVFSCSALAGWGRAREMEQRARDLARWGEFLCRFRVCLETTRGTPGEIIRMLGKQNAFLAFRGTQIMAEAFQESGSFAYAAGLLAENVRKQGPAEQLMLSLGDVIGIKSLEEQLSAIQAGEALLERETGKAREESQRYGGLCQRMGILLGLLAVVILA